MSLNNCISEPCFLRSTLLNRLNKHEAIKEKDLLNFQELVITY